MELKQALNKELQVLPTCEHYKQLLSLVGTSDECRRKVGKWTYAEWNKFIKETFIQIERADK